MQVQKEVVEIEVRMLKLLMPGLLLPENWLPVFLSEPQIHYKVIFVVLRITKPCCRSLLFHFPTNKPQKALRGQHARPSEKSTAHESDFAVSCGAFHTSWCSIAVL